MVYACVRACVLFSYAIVPNFSHEKHESEKLCEQKKKDLVNLKSFNGRWHTILFTGSFACMHVHCTAYTNPQIRIRCYKMATKNFSYFAHKYIYRLPRLLFVPSSPFSLARCETKWIRIGFYYSFRTNKHSTIFGTVSCDTITCVQWLDGKKIFPFSFSNI